LPIGFSAEGTPPYFGTITFQYRFPPGFGGGDINLNEVAVATQITNGAISSRSLTKNSGGDAATVPVLADEYLDVYYKRRNYPAHIDEATGVPTDDTGSIDVSGTPYGYTIRPSQVTVAGSWAGGATDGWASGAQSTQAPANGYALSTSFYALAGSSTSALGAVTSTLTNFQSTTAPSHGSGIYTGGTYSRELWWAWGATNANDPGGIGGLFIKTVLGAYQILFDTPIPKVLGETFTYYHNFSWDRKTTWV
jgi:hypothetical protein